MILQTRPVRLIRLLVFMAFLMVTVIGYSYSPARTQEATAPRLPELGVDNGFALALFYGSDIDGSLETCG